MTHVGAKARHLRGAERGGREVRGGTRECTSKKERQDGVVQERGKRRKRENEMFLGGEAATYGLL